MKYPPKTYCGKISYPTQREAHNARQGLIHRKDRHPADTAKVNIFECTLCGGWHIGRARRRIGSRPKRGGDRVLDKLHRFRELERGEA